MDKLIADEVLEKLDTLEDFAKFISKSPSGSMISEVGSPDVFLHRYKLFKERLQEELPEFTSDKILEFYKIEFKFREIYKWSGHHFLMAGLEFEKRKAENSSLLFKLKLYTFALYENIHHKIFRRKRLSC
jgi:hypothetical protein